MRKEIEFDCPVVDVRQLAPGQCLITFQAPEIARTARPGQFVALSCSQFLRRPLGIAAVDRSAGTVSVGGRAKGKGMDEILALEPGQVVSILGPLGTGYDLSGLDRCIVAGGGTGVYPMLFLLKELTDAGVKTGAAFGFRSAAQSILVDDFKALADHCTVASEAGDLDVEGDIMVALEDVFEKLVKEGGPAGPGMAILTCGPIPMMKKIADLAARRGLSCQVSMEERMACGVGLCLVCACQTKARDGGDGPHFVRCCKEGPVFPAEEVVW